MLSFGKTSVSCFQPNVPVAPDNFSAQRSPLRIFINVNHPIWLQSPFGGGEGSFILE